MPWLEQVDEKILSMLQSAGFILIVAAVVTFLYFLSVRALQRFGQRADFSEDLIHLTKRLMRWAATLLVLLAALHAAGLLKNTWAAITAVCGLIAIGFVAVWSVLSNALCSVILMVARPFKVGDEVEIPVDQIGGRVVNFNLLFTKLKTDDGGMLLIPNNTFVQKPVKCRRGKHRVELDQQLLRREEEPPEPTAGSTSDMEPDRAESPQQPAG
ncbi:MAG: mechanosensitive ion channel [Phycisphaeraceae bacterium]|nr:mechanosensitive ion channel [Phycisphaeraceae bacterium]